MIARATQASVLDGAYLKTRPALDLVRRHLRRLRRVSDLYDIGF